MRWRVYGLGVRGANDHASLHGTPSGASPSRSSPPLLWNSLLICTFSVLFSKQVGSAELKVKEFAQSFGLEEVQGGFLCLYVGHTRLTGKRLALHVWYVRWPCSFCSKGKFIITTPD